MRIVATFGWSWEPAWLVDQLRENLAWVDGFAWVDDRTRFAAGLPWRHEGEYRRLQREACERAQADWVLVTAPDERWEDRAEQIIRPLLVAEPMAYRVPLRTLWQADRYRVDGWLGRQRRTRLYRLVPGQQMASKRLHCPPVPVGLPVVDIDARVYDLKMIEPENRHRRDSSYANAGAASRRWRRLREPADGQLRKIPAGRGYSPAYRPFTFPGWS